MKSSKELIDALLFEAHETAEKIVLDTKKMIKDTLKDQRKKGKERAKDVVNSIEKKAQNDSKINQLREIASVKSKAKGLILKKKQALIENVLVKVKDELHKRMKNDEYFNFLENLIVEGGIILGGKDLEVALNERDSNLPLDYNKLAGKIEEKTGNKTNITKAGKAINVIGGTIIQTFDDYDHYKEIFENNPSLKLITETNTLIKFRRVFKTFTEKQTLPDIEDNFISQVLEDLLNNFIKLDTLEDRTGNIVLDSTFEGMLSNSKSEIRYKISQILFT